MVDLLLVNRPRDASFEHVDGNKTEATLLCVLARLFPCIGFWLLLEWDEIRLQHMGYNIFYIIGVIVVIAVILKFLGLY